MMSADPTKDPEEPAEDPAEDPAKDPEDPAEEKKGGGFGPCFYHQRSFCHYGDHCRFDHVEEPRAGPIPCDLGRGCRKEVCIFDHPPPKEPKAPVKRKCDTCGATIKDECAFCGDDSVVQAPGSGDDAGSDSESSSESDTGLCNPFGALECDSD